MHSVFKGVLGFGLVSIPVAAYRAVDADRVPLHWVHRACGHRIQYQKFCPVCAVAVTRDDLVKAVRLDDGRLVPLPETVTTERPSSERAIGIVGFHAAREVDPVYFDQAYWLVPAAGGQRAYRLLWEAMTAGRQVAVAWALWRIRRLAVVRPDAAGRLLLHTMHYPESVRAVALPDATAAPDPSDAERRLARQLVRAMSSPFRPDAYPNEPRRRVLEAAWAAAEQAAVPRAPSETVDAIIRQLKASVAALNQA